MFSHGHVTANAAGYDSRTGCHYLKAILAYNPYTNNSRDPQLSLLTTTELTTLHVELEDWHSEECKLTPTLTFDLLTLNETGDQDLSCTIHLPSLLTICPMLDC